jgi:hypothetical protein
MAKPLNRFDVRPQIPKRVIASADGDVALFVKQIEFRPQPQRDYVSAGTWNRGRSTVKTHPRFDKLRA